MVALSNISKSQCRFHLSYNAGTPAGDRARLERAMSEVPDSYTVGKIEQILVRCEDAFSDTQLEAGDLTSDEQVGITGDVVRTTTQKLRASWQKRQRNYEGETRLLARSLGVRNYSDPEEAGVGYLIEGGSYINSIPGIKGDTGMVAASSGLILNWSAAPTTGPQQTAIFIDIADGIPKIRQPNNGAITPL